MILYHYTSRAGLAAIRETSLSKGDVPITPLGEGLNGVWLTTDPNPGGHGLSGGNLMSDEERYTMQRWKGVLPPPGMRWENRREVRITIKLRKDDRNLKHWLTWSRRRVESAMRDTMIDTGGGKAKARSWYIYFGKINPIDFVSITDFEDIDLAALGRELTADMDRTVREIEADFAANPIDYDGLLEV